MYRYSSIELRRRIAVWILLSVFVPMTVMVSLHCHCGIVSTTDVCVQCVNHQPHAGHLSSGQQCVDNCVLCQFHSLPYVPASTVVLPCLVCLIGLVYVLPAVWRSVDIIGIKRSRAPPFVY